MSFRRVLDPAATIRVPAAAAFPNSPLDPSLLCAITTVSTAPTAESRRERRANSPSYVEVNATIGSSLAPFQAG